MSAPRVIFINRFYWPDEPATAQLLTDLAEALVARGWQVEIITSMPRKPAIPHREQRRGVWIHRLSNPAAKPASLWGRALLFAGFLTKACWFCLCHLPRGDIVITMTDPPLLGLWLWPVAKIKRARQLHWAQDIYPEVAISVIDSWMLRGLLKALIPLRNASWRHSTGCVTLGRDMASVMARAGLDPRRLHIIPNWAPAGIEPALSTVRDDLRRFWGLSDSFVVVYSGNMGRVHELDALLPLSRALRRHPGIVLLLVGEGSSKAALQESVRMEGLENVRFLPPQPREMLSSMLSAADIHLVTLRANCASSVFPSKFYGIAAVARPMMFVGPKDCELAQIIEQRGMGASFGAMETDGMAKYIIGLSNDPGSCQRQSAAAHAFSLSEGRIEHASALWDRLLRSLP
ncbi:MAG: glycosyltransferase family 4 protein [Opitutaceae bacterium]|jgi:hypothetical protein